MGTGGWVTRLGHRGQARRSAQPTSRFPPTVPRFVWWLLGALGTLAVLLGLAWFGYGLYIRWVVARSPATQAVIRTDRGEARLGVYRGGDQVVPEVEPSPPLPTVPRSTPSAPARPVAVPTLIPSPALTATPVPAGPILPPLRVRIPKIGVDAAVVAGDADHLPRFKGVGWYIGSGFPGFRGNLVLFGHLNGPYETFGRLDQLKEGDTVEVTTMEQTFTYRVTSTKMVPENAVEVLAPTSDRRLTLITCEGTFFPTTRDYSHRRVVIANLVEGG